MKKIVVYLCVGVMVLGLTACGRGNKENGSNEPPVESSVESTVESSVEESGDIPVEDGSADAGMDVAVGWSEEMEGMKAAVIEEIGEEGYIPNVMPLDASMLESAFGITSDMYDDFLAEMPMMSAHVDTLLIIKAKDDKVEAVEEALNAYRDARVSDSMQYPANVGKVQASRVERIGNYVCFVQLGGDTTKAAETGDEAVFEQCQQVNELVIEVISQSAEQ